MMGSRPRHSEKGPSTTPFSTRYSHLETALAAAEDAAILAQSKAAYEQEPAPAK